MGKYTVKAVKEGKEIITLKANDEICFDNYLWKQLGIVLDELEKGFDSANALTERINVNSGWFEKASIKKGEKADVVFDFDNMTVNKPYFPVYKIDDVCQDMCGITLIKKDNNYFVKYECDEDVYEVNHTTFDQPDLLSKDITTIGEFRKIVNFVNSILVDDDCAFILNDSLLIRFHNA